MEQRRRTSPLRPLSTSCPGSLFSWQTDVTLFFGGEQTRKYFSFLLGHNGIILLFYKFRKKILIEQP